MLGKFPVDDNDKILEVVKSLPSDPYIGDITKVKGEENLWRRRVGAFRIFYELIPDERIIDVLRIECRTSTTYYLDPA